jgi:5-methyltetrahydropteroyltriglutamate--homocysteine methyltransferase
MSLVLSSSGSYPRIGDTPELQILRRTLALADRGERTTADLADAENEVVRRAIEEQVNAGVELLTDGLIRWYDPVSHFAGRLDGAKIKGLLRFFDTNFYFRQPVLHARPVRKGPLVVEEYLFARNTLGMMPTATGKAGRLSIKPVLTGPYTLAKFSLSEDSAMNSLEARTQAYAVALAAEIEALIDAGADFIQIDEPAILKYPGDMEIFRAGLLKLGEVKKQPRSVGKKIQFALHTYFNDCAALYDTLIHLPVDVLGVDFTYNPKLVDVVAAAGSPVPLALGLVDARNTKLENPGQVARQIEKMLPKIAGGTALLGPSAGLEYLPRDRAYAKLELLGKVRAEVKGSK